MNNAQLLLSKGRVASVDKVRWTCTVQTEIGPPVEDVPIAPMYLGNEAEGVYHLPKVGQYVMLAQPFTGGKIKLPGSFILCAAFDAMDKDDPDDEFGEGTDIELNQYDGKPDFRADRPVLNEGDIYMSAGDGNFVALRAGGLLELGASQTARRYYVPIQNLIRDITSMYELNAAGGTMSWHNRRGEEGSWGTVTHDVITDPSVGEESKQTITINKTPTVFEMNLREFAQDEPIINLQMGRVVPDFEVPLAPGAKWEDVIFQFTVGQGLDKKLRLCIDKNGNTSLHNAGGKELKSYESDQWVHYAGGKTEEIQGPLAIKAGGRNVDLQQGGDTLTIHGDQYTEVQGNSELVVSGEETAGGAYTITCSGPITTTAANYSLASDGEIDFTATGQIAFDSSSDIGVNAGGNVSESICGAKTVTILNGNAPPAIQAYKLQTVTGEISIHAGAPGQVSITCGPPIIGSITPLAKMELTPLSATLSYTPIGGVGVVECSATGVNVRSAAFEVSVGAAGISMGPVGSGMAPAGAVVTTATHPMCYVTGLPIMGAANVGITAAPITPVTVPSGQQTLFSEKAEIG